jgi:cob(I)alamin adenosyltransferase
MVVLNRIYTRSGDDGTTALGTGERRKKYDLRIDAYGTLKDGATDMLWVPGQNR